MKSEYEEIERKIYVSDEGCSPITLSNNSSEAVLKPTGYIFEDVVESSTFGSDVYGAFDWTLEKELHKKELQITLLETDLKRAKDENLHLRSENQNTKSITIQPPRLTPQPVGRLYLQRSSPSPRVGWKKPLRNMKPLFSKHLPKTKP